MLRILRLFSWGEKLFFTTRQRLGHFEDVTVTHPKQVQAIGRLGGFCRLASPMQLADSIVSAWILNKVFEVLLIRAVAFGKMVPASCMLAETTQS